MTTLVTTYSSPSEAFWRDFELGVVRAIDRPRPILEIGSGDGSFSNTALETIDQAIDVNPHAVERARRHSALYSNVRLMGARALTAEPKAFATVYANCVLEHIPALPRVLRAIRTTLRPGGRLVSTVPLRAMSDYLVIRRRCYAEMRRRQLIHVNLLTELEWQVALQAADFTTVTMTPYLVGSQCQFWDRLDMVACLGMRRYRLGAAYRIARQWFLPITVQHRLSQDIARMLHHCAHLPAFGALCAVVIVAS
jgi:SAM-dependent methyltransferase